MIMKMVRVTRGAIGKLIGYHSQNMLLIGANESERRDSRAFEHLQDYRRAQSQPGANLFELFFACWKIYQP